MSIPHARDAYRRYLASPEWRQRRALALVRAGRRCAWCRARGHLQVHHLTYSRVGHERDDDLVVLCRRCHEIAHGLRPAKLRAEHVRRTQQTNVAERQQRDAAEHRCRQEAERHADAIAAYISGLRRRRRFTTTAVMVAARCGRSAVEMVLVQMCRERRIAQVGEAWAKR